MLEQYEGLILLALFGVVMVGLVWFRTHTERHADGFLVADREVSVFQGAFSIAVGWVWAPAIFVASLQAYTKGIPGAFWFIVPNVVCFFLFAAVAVKLRKCLPQGYTLPEFIADNFDGHRLSHITFTAATIIYLGSAFVANANAGGMLLNSVSGIDTRVAIISMGVIALSYSLLSGLKASVFTDVLQMFMVLGLAFVIVPFTISEGGGFETVSSGLGGVTGKHSSLFDIGIALSFGIPATIALMTGPISDQMFVQRAFAVREKDIVKTFVFGGLLFGLVPVALSIPGFIGASLVADGALSIDNPEMVAPAVIHHLLPRVALYAFVLMAFAGLCSTLDSALCAVSSLGGIDIYRRYMAPQAGEKQILHASRVTMLVVGVASTAIALLQPKILWVFMINGAITATMFFPVLLSLYWRRMQANAVALGVGIALLVGLPFSIYANFQDDGMLVMYASITTLMVSLLVSILASVLTSPRSAT